MRLHRNAALSWSGRRLLAVRVLEQGWTITAAAAAAGVSVRCARKWVGDTERPAKPASLIALQRPAGRQSHLARAGGGDRGAAAVADDAAEIAETLAMPLSTVSVVLKRHGIGRLGRIGLEQPVRYERSRPGELVHIDIKKLGRIEGGAGKRVGARTRAARLVLVTGIVAGVASLIGDYAPGSGHAAAAGSLRFSQVSLRSFTLKRSGIVLQLHPTEARIRVSVTAGGPLKACEYRGSWGSPFSKHWSRCLNLGPHVVALPSSGGAIHVSFLVVPTGRQATHVTALVLRWRCVDHYFDVKLGATRVRTPQPTFDC